MRSHGIALSFAIMSIACSSGVQNPIRAGVGEAHNAYLPWTVSHLAPDLMEAYLNGIVVFDIRNRMNPSVVRGSPSMRRPVRDDEVSVGWPSNPGWGSVTPVNLDLPKTLIVSWRSFVEQQEYHVRIEVSEDTRSQMKIAHRIDCFKNDGRDHYYRNNLVVGMAPGGIVKLWVNGPCLDAIEVGRFVAQRDRPDPAREGYATRALSEETKAYLKANPIPFDSW